MKFVILTLLMCSYQLQAMEEVSILLANNSSAEQAKKAQILRLIEQYDLEKWWFTGKIVIDEATKSPFSHPVLTLGVSRPNADLSGLSQLLHEQIHWYEDSRKEQVKNTISALKKLYPKVPVGYPDGARNESSTYLHLAVCLMELDALTAIVGQDKAKSVVANNGKYFYKWIYKTVLKDGDKIRDILKTNSLYI
ncbi:hypothetical protein [Shewanella insulae]|uniref:hypothetical protein n=1 Tax=Shewanella insulae TaxID=2681496 RepID=UPI00247FEE7A|nr:hypothetical protein [Shewanella insulae]